VRALDNIEFMGRRIAVQISKGGKSNDRGPRDQRNRDGGGADDRRRDDSRYESRRRDDRFEPRRSNDRFDDRRRGDDRYDDRRRGDDRYDDRRRDDNYDDRRRDDRYESRRSPRRSSRSPGRDRPYSKPFSAPRSTKFRLLIEGLPSGCNWQDLKDYFRTAGEVTYADVSRSRSDEGVVDFATFDDMKEALSKLNGKEMRGNKLYLREDVSRLESY
jgi:RNA recognition motif-containing protein